MAVDTPNDGALIRRYLLGDVSDADRELVEQRLMLEEEFLEQLLVEEDDLVDASLGGELSAADAARFRSVFLVAPERRAKLRFAQTLRGYMTVRAQTPDAPTAEARGAPLRRRWMAAAIAATLLITSGAGLLLWRSRQLERDLAVARGERESTVARLVDVEQRLGAAERENERIAAALRAEEEARRLAVEELAGRPAPPPASQTSPAPAIATIALEPGRLRATGASSRLVVGRRAEALRLRLAGLPAGSGPVGVALRDPDGTAVWSGRGSPRAGALVVYIPADGVETNDYQVVAERAPGEIVATYYLRIVRR